MVINYPLIKWSQGRHVSIGNGVSCPWQQHNFNVKTWSLQCRVGIVIFLLIHSHTGDCGFKSRWQGSSETNMPEILFSGADHALIQSWKNLFCKIFLPKSPVFSSFLNVYTSALFDLTTHAYLLKYFLPSSTPKRPKRCKRRQYVMHFSSPPISLVHKRNRKFWEQCIFRKIHLWKGFKILRFNRRIGAFKRGWQAKLHFKKFRFSTEMRRLRCSRGRTSAFYTTIISFYN